MLTIVNMLRLLLVFYSGLLYAQSTATLSGRVLATLLAEAWEPLQRRDYHALRNLCGVAPVTRRSGKTSIILRRRACHPRLANAVYFWAKCAVRRDLVSKSKYEALRARGHGYARALRSVADRLLNVACAMLRDGTLFNRALAPEPLPID